MIKLIYLKHLILVLSIDELKSEIGQIKYIPKTEIQKDSLTVIIGSNG